MSQQPDAYFPVGPHPGGLVKRPTVVLGRQFPSLRAAAEFVAEEFGISFAAARQRIRSGRVAID